MELPEREVQDPVSGRSVTLTMNLRPVKKFTLFEEMDKLTPANFHESVRYAKDSNGANAILDEWLKDPIVIRGLCDLFNGLTKSKLEEKITKNPDDMEMYETEDSNGVRP